MGVSVSNKSKYKTLLSAVAATGEGSTIDVRGKRHIVLTVSTANSANGTLKIQGACAADQADVDFSLAAAVGNEWDYVGFYNLNTQAAGVIDGDTGLVYTGTDSVEQLLVNVDVLDFITVNVTTHNAGNFTVKLRAINNA